MDRNFKRLLDTLRLIPRTRRATTAEIHEQLTAQGHAVSRRTVQRDLESLATQYDIDCDQRDTAYAWRWRTGAGTPVVPVLDLQRALAIDLMERELGTLMPGVVREALSPWLREARRVLRAHGGSSASRWVGKILFEPAGPPLQPARPAPGVMEQVVESLYLECQLEAEYRRAYQGEWRRIRVHPLGLVKTGLVTYLVARFEGHADARQLALHRMRRIRLLDARATAPAGFDLVVHVRGEGLSFGGGAVQKVHLRMARLAAAHLADTPLSDDQEIRVCADAPDWVDVRATVMDSPRLAWWINGFGDQAIRLSDAEES